MEVIAVISVIAVLTALMFPTLQKSRQKMAATTCISNLRQMAVAINAYSVEHDGELPVNNNPTAGGVRWYLSLNPYLGKSGSSDNGGWSRPSIFICPANDPKKDFTIYAIFFDASYWSNTFLMPRFSGTSWTNGTGPVRLLSAGSNRILVADNPKYTGASNYMCYFGNMTLANTQKPYGGNDSAAKIHEDGVNALFTDMSVRFLKATEINQKGRDIPTGPYFGN